MNDKLMHFFDVYEAIDDEKQRGSDVKMKNNQLSRD